MRALEADGSSGVDACTAGGAGAGWRTEDEMGGGRFGAWARGAGRLIARGFDRGVILPAEGASQAGGYVVAWLSRDPGFANLVGEGSVRAKAGGADVVYGSKIAEGQGGRGRVERGRDCAQKRPNGAGGARCAVHSMLSRMSTGMIHLALAVHPLCL